MIKYWKTCFLHKYATFSGRVRRSEYWFFVLANIIITVSFLVLTTFISVLTRSISIGGFFNILMLLYLLASIVPHISVTVRRLHDIGRGGEWYFISFVPFIGGIWMLILMCTDGNLGSNEFGPNPKDGGLEEKINNL